MLEYPQDPVEQRSFHVAKSVEPAAEHLILKYAEHLQQPVNQHKIAVYEALTAGRDDHLLLP